MQTNAIIRRQNLKGHQTPDIGEETFRFPLRILSHFFQDPEGNKTRYLAASLVYLITGLTGLALILLQFFYADGDVTLVVENFEAVVGYTQTICKIFIAAVKMQNFVEMLREVQSFRKILTTEAFARTLRVEKVYLFGATSIAVLVIMAPFANQMPDGIWTMGRGHLYIFAVVLQSFYSPFICIYSAAYDALFLSFCVHLKTQFTLLRCLLQDLKPTDFCNEADEDVYLKKLSSYVEYHNRLLRFSQLFRNTYSFIFLVQYSTAQMILCGEMYVMLESNDSFLMLKYLFTMACILLQLSIYCIPLTSITEEALLISEGMYESDWYSKRMKPAKAAVPLVIQRSQEKMVFRAGGLIEMDCGTILSVIKLAYSFCAIMRALKNT